MKIGFVVNDINAEQPIYTTTRMAMQAINMGHEAWIISVGDLSYDPDEYIRATARMVPRCNYKSHTTYFKDLQSDRVKIERITIDELDILLLRNNPADDANTDLGHKTLDLSRKSRHAARGDCPQRSEWTRKSTQQNVLPRFPGRSKTENAYHKEPSRDKILCKRTRWHDRPQTATRLWWEKRVPR